MFFSNIQNPGELDKKRSRECLVNADFNGSKVECCKLDYKILVLSKVETCANYTFSVAQVGHFF